MDGKTELILWVLVGLIMTWILALGHTKMDDAIEAAFVCTYTFPAMGRFITLLQREFEG